jgi:hypothetical protein
MGSGRALSKEELEALLLELDDAIFQAFPGPEPIRMLVVGGACLVFAEVLVRLTQDIDVIILDLLGQGEASLVYNLNPTTAKLRRLIGRIGRQHGLSGDSRFFLNDDCASFLLELGQGQIPETRLLKAYKKLHLYIPSDLRYILACQLVSGRPAKDFSDIHILCKVLEVTSRHQAQDLVDYFFPDRGLQTVYELPKTLDEIFTGQG